MAALPEAYRLNIPCVLIVTDDRSLGESVRYALEREGYITALAADARRAIQRLVTDHPGVVVVDEELAGHSARDVCALLWRQSAVPVLLLQGVGPTGDGAGPRPLGADGCVAKPFSMDRLTSRIWTLLRTAGHKLDPPPAEVLRAGPVELDWGGHEAYLDGRPLSLTPKEFVLLEALVRNHGRVAGREFLINVAWGPGYPGTTNTLDVHVRRLRRKLQEDPSAEAHIITERGRGYRLVTGEY